MEDISAQIIQYVLSSVDGYVPAAPFDAYQAILIVGISSAALITIVGLILYIKKKGN